ncbi:MAG TPA: hypothetical protein VF523_03735 [Burkholderiales bacterium]
MENRVRKCKTCGKALVASTGVIADALAEEESARCSRLREIALQRKALATKMQSGIVGLLGADTADTVDLVAQRKSLAQLDATLEAEAQSLAMVMAHMPDELKER